MCGLNETCLRNRLETYYRRLEERHHDMPRMEAELNRRMNAQSFNGRSDYRPDGHIDRNEIDFIVQDSNASRGGLRVVGSRHGSFSSG